MALEKESVRITCFMDVSNPACTREELEPLVDQALAKAKSRIFADIATEGGEGGGQCHAHDKEMHDKSRCPS